MHGSLAHIHEVASRYDISAEGEGVQGHIGSPVGINSGLVQANASFSAVHVLSSHQLTPSQVQFSNHPGDGNAGSGDGGVPLLQNSGEGP